MRVVAGIDPGIAGAIVVLMDGYRPSSWLAMPTIKPGKSSRVNGAAVAAFLRGLRLDHVYLERVGSMPGEGAVGGFSFGHSAGIVEGVVQALGLPYTLVTPQTWKRAHGLIGKDKDAARSMAVQIWPMWRELDAKGKGQALADAALLAYFGAQKLAGVRDEPARVTT